MNSALTEQIVHHVFANLGLIKTSFVNYDLSKSIVDKQFLLKEVLSFEDDIGNISKQQMYGCQIIAGEDKKLKILVGDCTQEQSCPEFCLLVALDESPTYAAYLVFNADNNESMIAVSMDGKSWVPCSTYLQATFLAGMERLRDLGLNWSECTSYKDQHDLLLSFLDFHGMIYGGEIEREEV